MVVLIKSSNQLRIRLDLVESHLIVAVGENVVFPPWRCQSKSTAKRPSTIPLDKADAGH